MNTICVYTVFLFFSLSVLGEEKIEKSASKKDKIALGDFLTSLLDKGVYEYGEYDGSNGKYGGYGSEQENIYGQGHNSHNHGSDEYGHGFGGHHNHGDSGYGHSVHHSDYGLKPYSHGGYKPNNIYGYGPPPPPYPYPPPPPPPYPPQLIGFLVFYPDSYMNGNGKKRA